MAFSSGVWGVGQPPSLQEKLGLEEKLTLGMGAESRPDPTWAPQALKSHCAPFYPVNAFSPPSNLVAYREDKNKFSPEWRGMEQKKRGRRTVLREEGKELR